MAINPFEQRVAIPDAGGVSSGTNVNLADVGSAVADLADVMLRTGEPYHRQLAIKQGKADAAALGTVKNPDGTWSMPVTPEGGLVYAAAFDEAKQQQYVLHVQNDFERELNRIYYSPDAIGKTPDDLMAEADTAFQGLMKGVDPAVQPVLFEQLTREIRQRDLQASGSYMRQQEKLLVDDLTGQIDELSAKAALAYSDDNDALGDASWNQLRATHEKLQKLGYATPGDFTRMDLKLVAARGAGDILRSVRLETAAGTKNSDDLQVMSNMLLGQNDDDDVIVLNGQEYTGDQFRALVPDDKMRQFLVGRFSNRGSQLEAEEREREKKDKIGEILGLHTEGANRPYGTSNEDWSAAVARRLSEAGVDPMTPEGLMLAYQFSPDLPDFYKKGFANLQARRPEDLEAMRPVFNAARAMMTSDGQNVDVTAQVFDTDDLTFMYHYDNARLFKHDPAVAAERARTAVAKKTPLSGEALTNLLIERGQIKPKGGGTKSAELFNQIDDHIGTEWSDLSAGAQEAIMLEVGQMVSMDVPFADAIKMAGGRFKQDWTPAPYTLGTAMRKGKGAEWIPKDQSIPAITDHTNPKGPGYGEWIKPYVDGAIINWAGEQVAGVPGKDKLRFNQNVFLKRTGRTTKAGGAQYALVYYDPKGNAPPVPLQHKDGGLVTMDFMRAYNVQESAARDFLVRKAGAKKAVEQSRNAAGIVPGAMRPGDPAKVAAAAKAEAEFKKNFGGTVRVLGPRNLADVKPPALEREIQAPRRSSASNVKVPVPTEGERKAMFRAANQLGIKPHELAAIFSKEASFNWGIRGGKNNGYRGGFQFGREERIKYWGSEHAQPTPEQQIDALVRFARDRGFQRGMGWRKLYTTINAGNPGASVYKHDGNGNQLDHYRDIEQVHLDRGRRYLNT